MFTYHLETIGGEKTFISREDAVRLFMPYGYKVFVTVAKPASRTAVRIPNVGAILAPTQANTLAEARRVIPHLSHNSLCALERGDEGDYAFYRDCVIAIVDKWNISITEQVELVQRGMDSYDEAYDALRR